MIAGCQTKMLPWPPGTVSPGNPHILEKTDKTADKRNLMQAICKCFIAQRICTAIAGPMFKAPCWVLFDSFCFFWLFWERMKFGRAPVIVSQAPNLQGCSIACGIAFKTVIGRTGGNNSAQGRMESIVPKTNMRIYAEAEWNPKEDRSCCQET